MVFAPENLTKGYLGPELPVGMTRNYLPFSSNKAASYVPRYLYACAEGQFHRHVEELVLNPNVTKIVLEELREDIKIHMEQRIHLFLQKLLIVYNTKLCFDHSIHAELQVGQGHGSYVGAHHDTLPSLRIAKENVSDTSVSFANGTSIYYDWNATSYLPEIVNKTDSFIDGNSRELENGCLRKVSIEILNNVAQGNLNPQQGFIAFLSTLVNVIQKRIDLSRDNVVKESILYPYLLVAENYKDDLENGFPLLQKLCFQPMQKRVDETFFLEMQNLLHQKMNVEFKNLQPEVKNSPKLEDGIDFKGILHFVSENLAGKGLTITIREHTKCAIVSNNVQTAVAHYFSELNQLSEIQRKASLDRLFSIKTSKTVHKIDLTGTETTLYRAFLEAIRRDRKTYEPRNINLIILKVLSTIGAQFLQEKTPILPPDQQTLHKQTLKEVIKNVSEDANIQLAKTSSHYLTHCKNAAKVKQMAAEFFKYLQLLPTAQQTAEIESLFEIKTTRSLGKAGLSSPAIKLLGAALETIREVANIKNPRNMGLILTHLVLLEAN